MSLDRVGTFAGLLCAVHCSLLGIAPALIAVAGVGTLWSPRAEWIAVAISSSFAFLGAVLGFRRHRRGWVPVLFLLSVAWMLGARWLEQSGHSGPWFAAACALGGVGAAVAHIVNRQCGYDHSRGEHSHAGHSHARTPSAAAAPVTSQVSAAPLAISAAERSER